MNNFFLLLILVTIFPTNADNNVDKLITHLNSTYSFSHYSIPGSYACWWKSNQDRELDVSILVRDHGWIGFGFSPNKKMVGSIAVFSRMYENGTLTVEERYLKDRKADEIILQRPDNIMRYSGARIDDYTLLQFVWNVGKPNDWYNFTLDASTSFVFAYANTTELLKHKHDGKVVMNLKSGEGSSGFVQCEGSCKNGKCVDAYYCECNNGYKGWDCSKRTDKI